MKSSITGVQTLLATASMAAILTGGSPADGAVRKRVDPRLAKIEALLADQAREIAAQNNRLAAQNNRMAVQDHLIAGQQAQLNAMRAARGVPTELAAAAPAPSPAIEPSPPSQSSLTPPPPVETRQAAAAPEQPLPGAAPLPGRPVGEAPEEKIRPSILAAIPAGMGVLTPRQRFVFEPSVEYDRTGANRLVFQGVEIIPGLQLGLVNATTADRDVVVATGDFRYGLTDRIELEARVPFLYRNDRLTTLAQQVTQGVPPVNQTSDLNGADLGDIELAARYQINAAREGQPTFIANLRLKTTTGRGPYDVGFDTSGIATDLATGSGFWGLEPSITVLVPTDPIVIFANVGYLKNFSRDINKTIGTTLVGNVDPGDSVDAAFGFGFALNPRFSFSLGYANSYIFGTSQQLGSTVQRSNDLEVGALTFGWSYRLRSNLLVSTNFQFGVTPDAPNLRFTLRLPISF